jgi:uncharacterized DUF497 family protein
MDFEWSEAKRIAVLEARGLDFIDAEVLFDGRPLYTAASPRLAERRRAQWAPRRRGLDAAKRDYRIITMRRARDEEKERYRALFG